MLAAAAKQVGAPFHAVPPHGVAASHLPLLSRQKPMLVPTQAHGQYGGTPVAYCQHALAAFCGCSLTKKKWIAYMVWVLCNLGPDVGQCCLQLSPAFNQLIAVNLHSQSRVRGGLSVERVISHEIVRAGGVHMLTGNTFATPILCNSRSLITGQWSTALVCRHSHRSLCEELMINSKCAGYRTFAADV